MDDLYFEQKLMEDEVIDRKKWIQNQEPVFTLGKQLKKGFDDIRFFLNDYLNSRTKAIFIDFDMVIDTYYQNKYPEKDYDEIYEMTSKFMEKLSDDNLEKMFKEKDFSEEELLYIFLIRSFPSAGIINNLSNATNSRYKSPRIISADDLNDPVREILIRDIIIQEFGIDALKEFTTIIQELPNNDIRFRKIKNYFPRLLSENPYPKLVQRYLGSDTPINMQQTYEDNIKKIAQYIFNQKYNCGSYALKIDKWVELKRFDFDQMVSSILNTLDFVRLLGDEPLQDDEYLVILRSEEDKINRILGAYYHFIRVDSDGIVREKNGVLLPKVFENWGNLENAPEAIFAVKKEHKFFGYSQNWDELDGQEYEDRLFPFKNGLNFQESVAKAINEKNNDFSYHEHDLCLKKTGNDEIVVTDEDDNILAYVVYGDGECLIDIVEGKEAYISNCSGFVTPKIQNGKLINFDEFKGKNIGIIGDSDAFIGK